MHSWSEKKNQEQHLDIQAPDPLNTCKQKVCSHFKRERKATIAILENDLYENQQKEKSSIYT